MSNESQTQQELAQALSILAHLHQMLHALSEMVVATSEKVDLLLAASGVDADALKAAEARMRASREALQAALEAAQSTAK